MTADSSAFRQFNVRFELFGHSLELACSLLVVIVLVVAFPKELDFQVRCAFVNVQS